MVEIRNACVMAVLCQMRENSGRSTTNAVEYIARLASVRFNASVRANGGE
jgi:hypothetical protein